MITLALVILFIAACLSAHVRRGLAYLAGTTVVCLVILYYSVIEPANVADTNARWNATNCPRILADFKSHGHHPTVVRCQNYMRTREASR